MKNYFIRLALFAAGCCVSNLSQASAFEGSVSNVTPYGTLVFIFVSGTFGGAASSCYSSSAGMVYSFDPSTPEGKAILATVLSAKLASKTIYIYGNGTCSTSGNPYDGGGSETMVGIDLKG